VKPTTIAAAAAVDRDHWADKFAEALLAGADRFIGDDCVLMVEAAAAAAHAGTGAPLPPHTLQQALEAALDAIEAL